ncbi:hypothetical protein M0804_013120 [Polistes exclamans]|nr:hypothetical protein M0804_013120 [Polistes exclamans]
MGLKDLPCRRSLNGAFIWQVKGSQPEQKTDLVAEAQRRTLPEAKVTRLQRMNPFRLVGLDPRANLTSIRCALLEVKPGVDSNQIRVGEI